MENPVLRFRPDRPIYLNTTNTGFKTENEVFLAVGKLRELHWLCVHNEHIVKPFHLCFTNEEEFASFKKCCSDLKITLKNPVIKADDIEEMETQIEKNPAEDNSKNSIERISLK